MADDPFAPPPPEVAAEQLVAALAAIREPLVIAPGVLRELDRALDEWLSFAEVYGVLPAGLEALTWPLAAFVGQALVELHDVRWLPAGESGGTAAVRLASGRVIDLLGSARLVLVGLAPPRFAEFERL